MVSSKKLGPALIGCEARFDDEGKLCILSNAQVIKQGRSYLAPVYRVIGFKGKYVIITSDSVTISRCEKKFCKII